jgi:DNA-binding NarL/FixJ family response regulator
MTVVARCTNGHEALAAITRHRPDGAVLDLTMPGRSGMDLLHELHATHTPVGVVLLTARIEHEQVLEALKLGVAAVLTAHEIEVVRMAATASATKRSPTNCRSPRER